MLRYIKYLNILKNFFLEKNFILVNSPLQFLNVIEYIKKTKDKSFPNDIYIGYTNEKSIKQIFNINKKFQLNFNLIPLSWDFNINFFHKILYLKKKLFGFSKLIVGDINYYLFREFYKYSKFSIILDDGTSALESKLRKKAIFFSVFKKKNNVKNDYNFLKSKKVKNKINYSLIYIIGSASVERNVLPKKKYLNIIKKIYSDHKKQKIIYIPHRLEKIKYLQNTFPKLLFKNISIPVEVEFALTSILPYKVYGFYSSALFNLKKLFQSKIKFVNIDYTFKYILDKKLVKRHYLIKKANVSHKIKNFIY